MVFQESTPTYKPALASVMSQIIEFCLPKVHKGFPVSSVSKESSCMAGDLGLIPGLGRSPGEGNGKPLQYPCLENPKDRGAWGCFSPWSHKEYSSPGHNWATNTFKVYMLAEDSNPSTSACNLIGDKYNWVKDAVIVGSDPIVLVSLYKERIWRQSWTQRDVICWWM